MNVACMTRLLLMGVMQNLKSLKLKLYKGAPNSQDDLYSDGST